LKARIIKKSVLTLFAAFVACTAFAQSEYGVIVNTNQTQAPKTQEKKTQTSSKVTTTKSSAQPDKSAIAADKAKEKVDTVKAVEQPKISIASDCTQDENAKRFMARGNAALKTAEKPEDYKLAAEEFAKALEYAPKCSDLHYSLALCYEKMGVLDPGNYKEAISYLNSYLALNTDVANKDEIQNKIYEIEFLLEKSMKQPEVVANNTDIEQAFKELVGKWKCYKANGQYDKLRDMEIISNEGLFFVQYCIESTQNTQIPIDKNKTLQTINGSEIVYSNGIFEFQEKYNFGEWGKSSYWWYWNMHEKKNKFYLQYKDNKLMGYYETRAHIHTSKPSENIRDGREGLIVKKCDGDCNYDKEKIYFVKQ
jgi:tetratricopeptide (TPR) repeat protein